MKSVVMGSWNLTVAFGNLIVILVAGIDSGLSQSSEFFLFAGIMFLGKNFEANIQKSFLKISNFRHDAVQLLGVSLQTDSHLNSGRYR